MKAFIYDKKTSKKLLTLDNVDKVEYIDDDSEVDKIRISTIDDGAFVFETKHVKTTVFINS